MGGVQGWPSCTGSRDQRDASHRFGKPEDQLEPVDWNRFFELFDRSGVKFLYDPEGHMNKFARDA
jgi:hypothetical protein